MPDLTPEAIAAAAQEPASATVDGRSAAAVPIPDQIEAARFAAASDALAGTNDNGGPRSGWAFLRPARARPGGAV